MGLINKSSMFPEGIIRLHNGTVDYDTGRPIRAILVLDSFLDTTFIETNRDAFDFVNDIPAADRATSLFKALGTNDIVKDATNDNVNFSPGTVNLTYPTVTSGNACRGVVVFKSDTGGEATSPLLCYANFTASVAADGGTVTVTLNADGIFRVSYD